VSERMDMNHEVLDSQLSAMFDGQLPAAECELLVRRMGRDEQLRARWARYAVIGAVMRSEPVAAARGDFARRVSAAITADATGPARAREGRRRTMLQVGLGGALVASVAAMAVLLLRQSGAPATDEVVIAQAPPAAQAPADAPASAPAVSAAPAFAASREPASYVVPPASSGGALAPPAELANFIVAHSEYSSPLMRRNLLSALVSSDAAEAEKAPAPPDAKAAGAADASDGSPRP